jgi:hypothetical protein
MSFKAIRVTAGICIGRIWRGLYTQRDAVSLKSKSETKYFTPEIFQKKVAFIGEFMRKEQRPKGSGRSSRSTERGYGMDGAA